MQSPEWENILLLEDEICVSDDHTLKDRIAKLTGLLQRDDINSNDVLMIKYYRELYSKFTRENSDFCDLIIRISCTD